MGSEQAIWDSGKQLDRDREWESSSGMSQGSSDPAQGWALTLSVSQCPRACSWRLLASQSRWHPAARGDIGETRAVPATQHHPAGPSIPHITQHGPSQEQSHTSPSQVLWGPLAP